MKDKDIVKKLSDGYTAKDIADEFSINVRTLEAKLIRLRDKSGSKNTTHMVANYLRKKLIK
jgi:DNA-binding CsgD family transcriptional regulator